LLTGYAREPQFTKLLVAPSFMRNAILDLIANETSHGPDGHIVLKLNSLVDAEMIDALYAASRAGVSIDLIIRGICCLRPGVPGLSETIRVRSIVGRYLEHARIFRFAHGGDDGDPAFYMGSADLMPRNLDRRVEALVPVEDPALRDQLDEIIDVNLADDTLAWALAADSTWHHLGANGARQLDAHRRFQELALERRTPS
jgi:polyphosphate kinase